MLQGNWLRDYSQVCVMSFSRGQRAQGLTGNGHRGTEQAHIRHAGLDRVCFGFPGESHRAGESISELTHGHWKQTFGFATEEYQVTAERLGVYLPVEHIDNPKCGVLAYEE